MAEADDAAQTRLAVYGTLAPGRENHGQLRALAGDWRPGEVRGRFYARGWGRYPGLVLDPGAQAVAVQIFASDDLPAHWPRLDAFEGDGYRRVVTEVATPDGPLSACVYVLTQDPQVTASAT